MSRKLEIILKKSSLLSALEIQILYKLCCQSVAYQWDFFNELLALTDHVYFGLTKDGQIQACCAITYKNLSINQENHQLIKTNLVFVSKEYRGGSFIRKVGWRSMVASRKIQPRARRYWVSVMVSPLPYLLMGKTFHEFYPHPMEKTSHHIDIIINYLSAGHFKKRYKDGVFCGNGLQGISPFQLQQTASNYTRRLHNFFIKKTPDYSNGSALICIVPLNVNNVAALILKSLKKTFFIHHCRRHLRRKLPSFYTRVKQEG